MTNNHRTTDDQMATAGSQDSQRPVFVFMDETGTTADPKQKYLGVGALMVDRHHLSINQALRDVFLAAVSELGAAQERFEFKFTYITRRSVVYYVRMLRIMQQHHSCWQFRYRLVRRNSQPFWNQYLKLSASVLKELPMRPGYILLADHVNKPRRAHSGLSSLIKSVAALVNVLQIEGQGSVVMQIADVLLGAVAFHQRRGTDEYKQQIANTALQLIHKKTGAGIDPIYAAPNHPHHN